MQLLRDITSVNPKTLTRHSATIWKITCVSVNIPHFCAIGKSISTCTSMRPHMGNMVEGWTWKIVFIAMGGFTLRYIIQLHPFPNDSASLGPSRMSFFAIFERHPPKRTSLQDICLRLLLKYHKQKAAILAYGTESRIAP